MRSKELLGMAAALALVIACKDDTERVSLADCESGPKAGVYERTVPTDHRVKVVNLETFGPIN